MQLLSKLLYFHHQQPIAIILSDGSQREEQCVYLAEALGAAAAIWSVDAYEHTKSQKRFLAKHLSAMYKTGTPKYVINIGNQHTDFALSLKQHFPTETKWIQYLDPSHSHDAFDAVIVPDHEPVINFDNAIPILGLLNKITPERLKSAKTAYQAGDFPLLSGKPLKYPIITVLLGGKHIGGDIKEEDARLLARYMNIFHKHHRGSFLITTSKRTGGHVVEALLTELDAPHRLHDFHDRQAKNPYMAMLALADILIVTGDSIRMCSEACTTGKPVFIFQPEDQFVPYKELHRMLVEQGHAKLLEKGHIDTLWQPKKTLDETARVANLFKGTFFEKDTGR